MQQRSRWSIAAVLTAIFAFLGLIASSPAAFAAVSLPSPPAVTMVQSSGDIVIDGPQLYRLSPKPGETGFTVVSYYDQHTTDPGGANDNLETHTRYAYGESAGEGSETGLGSAPLGTEAAPRYVRARMNVTLSDSTPYSTGWSAWVKVQRVTSTTPPPVPPAPPANQCPTALFIGVRGSGETKNDAGGYGNTIADVKQRVERAIPSTESLPIHYTATPVKLGDPQYGIRYLNSMATGRQALRGALASAFQSKCTKTRFILAGYSQGAQVAADVYQNLSKSQRARVTVLLFGEPRFNPFQSKVNKGDYDRFLFGSFPGYRIIQGDAVGQVRSYCTWGDPICNASAINAGACLLNNPGCPHLAYIARGWTEQAAKWAVEKVRQSSS